MLIEISKGLITKAINKQLNEFYHYNGWEPYANHDIKPIPYVYVSASECFKKLKPKMYNEYVCNYCKANNIIIKYDSQTKKYHYYKNK